MVYKNNIKQLIKTLLIIIFSNSLLTGFSQIIDNDQVSPRVRWEQINLPNHRVIFPQRYREQAVTLAQDLIPFRHHADADLKVSSKKIPVVLHANHVVQNGFVQLAPRKTEFFPLPSGIGSNVEWLPNLAQHELRHVAQMDKLTGRLRAPFLEQFSFALFGLHLPGWYFEGDAVATETNFSTGGRGRLPSWFMPIRANELAGRKYGFDKNILGSFKDITPSFYETGYLMNVHLTNQFGYDAREQMLTEMRSRLFRPFNFYKALKRQTGGLNSARLYHAALDSIGSIWHGEAAGKSHLDHIAVPGSPYPVHYLLPQKSGNKLYALWHGPQNIPHIITIEAGETQHIAYTGQQLMPYFHVNKNLLIWDELQRNARYGKNTFQVIHVLDMATQNRRTYQLDDFLYTPVLSPDNRQFAAVRVDPSGRSALLVYDLASGERQVEFLLPRGTHIQQPQFHGSKPKVVCIAVSDKGTSILAIDFATNELRQLLPWGHQSIERPIYQGEDVVYKAHYNGVDNIYRLHSETGEIDQLTDALYGAFNPSPVGADSLLINDYTTEGQRIAMIPSNTLRQIDVKLAKEVRYDRYAPPLGIIGTKDSIRASDVSQYAASNRNEALTPLAILEAGTRINLADKDVRAIDSTAIRPYHTISGLLNFHSLSISNNNFESLDNFRPGVFWLANDLLNTSQVTLGYEYDTDIRQSIYSAALTYAKYLPRFSVRYENRGQIGQARTADDDLLSFDWRENYYAANMQLPFSLFRRDHIYSFGAQVGTSYVQRYQISVPVNNFRDEIAFPMNYQLYFNRNRRQSMMDLQPRWGQNFSATYRHIPFGGDQLRGRIFSVRTGFFFPGIFKNHGIQARLSFQHKADAYQFNNDIPVVAGFGYFPSPVVDNTLLLAYRLPVAYPDWAIGPLAYIKRIQARIFSDYQNIQALSFAPKTFGVGLSADLNVLRYVLPNINVGVQGIYINDSRATQRVVPVFNFGYTY